MTNDDDNEPGQGPQLQSYCRKPHSRSLLTSVGLTPTTPEQLTMKSESDKWSLDGKKVKVISYKWDENSEERT